MTTKADRIRKLYAAGWSVRDVAEIVGCREEYVRVAARQRAGGKMAPADINFRSRRMAGKSRDAARVEARKAYRAAREAGASMREAAIKYARAWDVAMGIRHG